ncbi:putative methylesterase 11, chloroplastic isoform X2 [Elaeis guineensis]|uniref:Methylesterase 11, chloroplastic isoform X2 n=1 Tax=Elaeis guineensis var. tenera TaxID=51953 RepID=A0A6J0PRN3_ELAGV|nr:putative methylesterase 11, chloroplastic isoform X2 [Elaeis guineensis]
MGSLVSCFSAAEETKRPPPPHRRSVLNAPPKAARGLGSSERWSKGRAGRKERAEEAMIHEQAAAAAEAAPALLAPQNGGVLPFDRSSSLRYPGHGQKKQALPRSSSSRARSFTDQVVQPQQLVNQDLKIDNLETNHFVLVHGGGFGAWCWYKTIALLEDSGFKVNAIDLTGSGIHSFDTNKITTLPEYVQPLTSFLESLGDGEKADTNDLMQQAQIFVYANGNDHPPTAIDLNKSSLKELLFNQSPAKDVALALVSMRPIPFAPVLEKLSLTDKNYGSVRRFYIETTEDNALLISLQQNMCSSNPPERIFRLKGADHSPFFSKPQALNKLLIEISKITSPEAQ